MDEPVSEEGWSRLDFAGWQVFEGKKPSAIKLQAMEAELTKEDSKVWRNLSKAMAKDPG